MEYLQSAENKIEFILTEERTRIGGNALSAPPVSACGGLSFPDCDFVSYILLKSDNFTDQGEALRTWLSAAAPEMRFEVRNGFLNCRAESALLADRIEAFGKTAGAEMQNEDAVSGEDFYTAYAINRLQALLREFSRKEGEGDDPAQEKEMLIKLLDRDPVLRTGALLILSASGMLDKNFLCGKKSFEICFQSGIKKARLRENAARLFYLYDSARQNADGINFLFYRAILAFLLC